MFTVATQDCLFFWLGLSSFWQAIQSRLICGSVEESCQHAIEIRQVSWHGTNCQRCSSGNAILAPTIRSDLQPHSQVDLVNLCFAHAELRASSERDWDKRSEIVFSCLQVKYICSYHFMRRQHEREETSERRPFSSFHSLDMIRHS